MFICESNIKEAAVSSNQIGFFPIHVYWMLRYFLIMLNNLTGGSVNTMTKIGITVTSIHYPNHLACLGAGTNPNCQWAKDGMTAGIGCEQGGRQVSIQPQSWNRHCVHPSIHYLHRLSSSGPRGGAGVYTDKQPCTRRVAPTDNVRVTN